MSRRGTLSSLEASLRLSFGRKGVLNGLEEKQRVELEAVLQRVAKNEPVRSLRLPALPAAMLMPLLLDALETNRSLTSIDISECIGVHAEHVCKLLAVLCSAGTTSLRYLDIT